MQYPPGTVPTEPSALGRFLKMLYFILFTTVGLYWVVLEMLAGQIEPVELGPLKSGLAAAAAATGGIAGYLRFGRIGSLLADATSDLGQRLARLRSHYIICYTLSEAVALYGFVVRMLGGGHEEAVPFFVGAVGLFLLCYPRVPAGPGSSTGS